MSEGLRDNGFQEYMVLKDCPYCHDSANFAEIAASPRTVKCHTCGLYRLYPRMNRYGQTAMLKNYEDEEVDLTQWNSPLVNVINYSSIIEKTKRIFPFIFPGGRVLDVGCGEGSFVAALTQAGANATGIEPIEKIVKFGKEYGSDLRVGRFEVGGMPSDLKKHSFDLICFLECIYYMSDLSETFGLINTYLKPGGGLYIKCHTPSSMYYFKDNDYSSRYGRGVAGMPTKKALTYMLNHEGYRIHEIGYYPENIFHTIQWIHIEEQRIGKITGGLISPIIHAIEKGDRIGLYASKV